jgi:hypothetical protein
MTPMVPTDPAARDFAIDCFMEDWASGRAEPQDGDRLKSQLRAIGDVARLERVARYIGARA